MSGRTLIQMESPKTQSIDAVKALLSWRGIASDPLPREVSLDGRLVLVLSNKKDAYYVTTPKSCSCPSATYNPGKPCKHMTAYFKATSAEPLCDQVNSRAVREQFYASMRAAGAV